MYEDYLIVDIETCPNDLECYFSLEEEDRLKKLNPIDSKIVALGIKVNNEDKVFMGEEKLILSKFWDEFKKIKLEKPGVVLVGFGITNFDLPFIVAKSFIHNIKIVPFSLKSVLDLREKINAYRYGKTRGKLEEYGKLLGLEISSIDGSKIAELIRDNKLEDIKNYLIKDLEITEKLFERAKETEIIHISRW